MTTDTNEVSDTPLTDALMFPNGTLATNVLEHARELERKLKIANDEIQFYEKIGQEKVDELRESKAEVERLRELLSLEKNGHEGTKKICDKILDLTRKTPSRAWHRANKKIPLK